MSIYNPLAWYWIVSGKSLPNDIFSSALPGYIASTDAGYTAWLAAGNLPSKIICDGELADVLCNAGVPYTVVAAAGVDTFTECNVGMNLADGTALMTYIGCRISSTGTPALSGTYGIQMSDIDNYNGLQAGIEAGAPWIGYIRDINGTQHTMTSTQATEVLTGILAYMEALDANLATWAGGGSWVSPTQPTVIA
jgi:hypothetical protein